MIPSCVDLAISMADKLILFDIDGTLLSARGAPKKAMGNVLKKRYGQFDYDHGYNFAGRTDWEIILHLLEQSAINIEISDDLIKELMQEFAVELKTELAKTEPPLVFAGVQNLLYAISDQPDLNLGLVTGNIEQGARLKLHAAGLSEFFDVGAFGDDAKERWKLPPIAVKRAEQHFNKKFLPQNTWIIGDSVHDINCARENNLKCIAVSTGWTDTKELQAEHPDFLLDDLAITDEVLHILI